MVTQDNINKAFQMIISSASDLDMILPKPPKADDEKLSLAEQRKMLAVFARYISEGHPGFATQEAENITFSENVKNRFKAELVKLYLSSKNERTLAEMGKELFKFSKKYLPDNHVNIYTSQGFSVGTTMTKEEHAAFKKELTAYLQNDNIDSSQRGMIEHLYAERDQVGKNLFYDNELEPLKQNGADILSDKKGLTWRMTEINHQDSKIMMIGMTSFAAIDDKGQLREDLIKDFNSLAKEFSKQEYKNCDALILDLRGNGGGWPYIGDYMARTLYGNTVSTEPKSYLKMDTLAAKLSYAYMSEEDYSKAENKKERLKLRYDTQNTKYRELTVPWAERYPFNAELGYKKPILVLTDQNTGSNAELTISRLRRHPYMRSIGEHSCGIMQYHPAATPKASIPLPYGLKMALPPEGNTGPNGERLEGIGYRPDYPTPKGENALLMGLNKFDEIKAEILQCPKQEEVIKTEAKRESKIDDITLLNRKSIGNSNPSLGAAFNELVNTTATIPQLKDISRMIANTKAKQA